MALNSTTTRVRESRVRRPGGAGADGDRRAGGWLGHLVMLAAVVALIPAVSSETGCQAASPFGLLAGYSPSSNVSQAALIDLDVRSVGAALSSPWDASLALSIYKGGNYSLQALSTQARAMMSDCAVGCPFKHYQMYFSYFGDHDYADKWVRAAIERTPTNFANSLGNANFSADISNAARRRAAGKGAAILSTWMWSVGMFEEAVNLCNTTDNVAALGFWDKGVAYYTGSLEGADGNSKTGTYGEVCHTRLEPRTSGPQTGLLLIRWSLALDS